MPLSTVPTRRPWCLLALAVLVVGLGACADGGAGGEPTTTATVRAATSVAPATDDDAEPRESEVELAGTSWRLVAVVDTDGASIPAAGDVPAVISFDETEVEGYDGVDTAFGSYELDGDELSVDLEEVSELGPGRDPGIEQLLFELLVEVERAELDDGDLVLHHDGGELRLEPVGGGTAE